MENKVLEIMSNVFNVDILNLSKETSKENLSEWDSMSQLNLMVEIENEFDITFENDEMITVFDFNSLIKILKNKL